MRTTSVTSVSTVLSLALSAAGLFGASGVWAADTVIAQAPAANTAPMAVGGALPAAESAAIYSLVEATNKAFMAGDADTIIASMFEPELQASGGAKVVRELTLSAMKELKQNGVRVESSAVGQPGAPIAAGRYTVVLVPKSMVMSLPGKRINIKGYMLAVRDGASGPWKLLDGAGFHGDIEALQKVFPDLPSGIVLPEEKNEVLS